MTVLCLYYVYMCLNYLYKLYIYTNGFTYAHLVQPSLKRMSKYLKSQQY